MLPGMNNLVYLTTLMLTGNCSQTLGSQTLEINQPDLKQLEAEDRRLNETKYNIWGNVTIFLFSADMDKGQEITKMSNMYVQQRRSWIQQMQMLSPSSDILCDGTYLVNRNQELKESETLYQSLTTVYNTSLNFFTVQDWNTFVLNLSKEFDDTYEYDIGIRSITLTEKYLKHLEIIDRSVHHLTVTLVSQNLSDPLILTWISNFLSLQECQQLLATTRQNLIDQKVLLSRIDSYLIFRDYIDPPIYIILLLVGLVWNVVLLIMFARRKEVRTAPNIMIFNIVIADIGNLTFNLPLQYFGFYYPSYVQLSEPVCILFITLRCMFTSASALSVVALSAQRFCATLPAFHNFKARFHLSPLVITVVYILLIWAAASSIVLPDTLLEKVCDNKPSANTGRKSAKIVSFHEFLVYCFVLPGLMLLFTAITARRLRQSAKQMPGDVRQRTHEDARHRGATVVTALCIVFTLSYIPFFMWGRIATLNSLDRWKLPYRILDNITYYLLFANSCFNPLALYVSSRTFRRLFNFYLFSWCDKYRKLNRTDTQVSYDNTTQSSKQQESDM